MSSSPKLFQPIKVGNADLKHRVVLAPLTRFRADVDGVHSDNAVTYYGQRASVPGTLLITEATFISPQAGGYDNAPGIYSEAQIAAWKKITDQVHRHGSYIFVQLWALGRSAAPAVLKKRGFDLVSASDIPIEGKNAPRPLTTTEVQEYVQQYAVAAKNAVRAGFDGVELHSANGYLPDQFLQSNSNQRTDQYGGSVENRIRFTSEILAAIAAAIGESRTAVRFSPWSRFQNMRMADPVETFKAIISHIAKTHPKFAYVSLVEPRVFGDKEEQAETQHTAGQPADSNGFALEILHKAGIPVVSGGGYSTDPQSAFEAAEKHGVLPAFGRAFIPNPDLPTRLLKNIPLTDYNRKTFYLRGPDKTEGYTDYAPASQSKL